MYAIYGTYTLTPLAPRQLIGSPDWQSQTGRVWETPIAVTDGHTSGVWVLITEPHEDVRPWLTGDA